MKSPVHYIYSHRSCISWVKKKIPPRSVVNSFFLYSGELELSLAAVDRFVCAYTNSLPVYEFWECMQTNPELIWSIATSSQFGHLSNPVLFEALQETWYTYKDPYVRAALFYLLNSVSSTGAISSGEYAPSVHVRSTIRALKNFRPHNLHLKYFTQLNVVEYASSLSQGEYDIYALGKFNYNFLRPRRPSAVEEAPVDHIRFARAIGKAHTRQWILLYKYHPEIIKMYKDFSTVGLDKYGNVTDSLDAMEDVVVTNF